MVIARSTRENIPFVLERERELPPDQQTTFLLAVLSNTTMLALLQLMQTGQTRAWVEVALRAGLRGWSNFPDQHGNETPFKRDEKKVRTLHGVEIHGPVSDATLEVLPSDILMDLAQAIVTANKMTADDAKN